MPKNLHDKPNAQKIYIYIYIRQYQCVITSPIPSATNSFDFRESPCESRKKGKWFSQSALFQNSRSDCALCTLLCRVQHECAEVAGRRLHEVLLVRNQVAHCHSVVDMQLEHAAVGVGRVFYAGVVIVGATGTLEHQPLVDVYPMLHQKRAPRLVVVIHLTIQVIVTSLLNFYNAHIMILDAARSVLNNPQFDVLISWGRNAFGEKS